MPIRLAVLAAAAAAAAFAPPAAAQGGEPPQVVRHELMEKNGDMANVVGDMLKGERPYDAVEATTALETIITDLRAFVEQFPEGSETGYDTRALPAIWTDRAGFEAANDESIAAAERALAVAADGVEALRPAFGALGGTCRDCHEQYRAEKN